MKNVILSIFVLYLFSSCTNADDEQAVADLLIGRWKHVNNTSTIQFDKAQNYTISFGRNMTERLKYHVDKASDTHKIHIFDDGVKIECIYQFIGNDELTFTQILPYGDSPVGTYYRQP